MVKKESEIYKYFFEYLHHLKIFGILLLGLKILTTKVRKSTYFGMKINFEEIFLLGSVIVCFWKSFYFSKDCFAIFVMKIAIVLVERFKNAPKKL